MTSVENKKVDVSHLESANKCIAITGGASGLGKAMALQFAKKGWNVAIADINETRGEETLVELKQLSIDAFYVSVNVCSDKDIENWCDAILERWGKIDVVINNAGIGLPGGINENSIADWQKIVDINFMGVVRGCRSFGEIFKRQGFGHIVNIASMAGLVHLPNVAGYSACKAAVVALSESIRYEFLPHNIGVSVVCPGVFKTNLVDSMPNQERKEKLEKMMSKAYISADKIALDVFNAVENDRFMVLTHWFERVFWWIKRFVPPFYYFALKLIGKSEHKKLKEKEAISDQKCSQVL